jgi:uncharacterized radical SAM superfamily Fe-S cluster-containing enzyme
MPLTAIEKSVFSLCPVCLQVVAARIFQEGERVFIEKNCQEHGGFRDLYWSDADLYRKFERYWCDGSGMENAAPAKKGCPFDCGICQNHLTATLLGNIDVTNRCNLSCPVCFADAGDRIYEPSIDQIRSMLQSLRAERPVPCPAVQFSGGEPTVREDLLQIVALAKELGFFQIQIATNGLKLAASLELCQSLERSGLNTVYLQFDGVTPEPYRAVRGRDLLPLKQKAIENLRSAGQTSVVLVPTLARGVNDLQVGDIVRFASRNLDVVKGVNFQPVSFAGRIGQEERARSRITIPDLLSLLEEQTDNEITRDDFYPVPFVAPISHLIAAETGSPQPVFTVHPCCGAATYLYHIDGRIIPITRFIDVEGLLEKIRKEVESFDGSGLGKLKMKGMILKEMPKFIDESRAPRDLNITRMLLTVFKSGTRESLTEFHNRTLFLGVMHFQDVYNMDLERLRRCGVHYATPDGRIIPFCSYNTIYRKEVEDQFSFQSPNDFALHHAGQR